MKLFIKPSNEFTEALYSNHQHYNPGDSGIDLFTPETITVQLGETVKINLQIKCEALHDTIENTNVSYYLYPRSSIVKTPLRMSNSVGIIDAGYRGEIIACVDNIKNEPYTITQGDSYPYQNKRITDLVNQGKLMRIGREEKYRTKVMICGNLDFNVSCANFFLTLGWDEGNSKTAGSFVQ